ncbi:uncharacterized protein LOC134239760 [Saccostrea cucullata]|uniref:uncharacterized protein LOC134239760 n=1 Tax=Saccostrea cuccullata TaxID=36930 RepID=UPI002ED4B7C4
MRISRRVRLVNVEILGVIYGSLAGFATLVGLTVCLCMKCRKTTSNQGAVLYETVANVGTGVQRPIQSYNQEGVYTPLPVQQQTPGEFEMVSIALPPQHSAPPTVNQDPQRN